MRSKCSIHMQSQQQDMQGLSTHEVEERRAHGLGCVPPPVTSRSYLRIVRENVLNAINVILFSIALALVFLGQYLDAFLSISVISFNMLSLIHISEPTRLGMISYAV